MPVKATFHIDTRPLGEAITLKRGISWDRTMERDAPYPGTYPVLRIPNVQNRLVLNDLLYLTGISHERAQQFAATRGWTVLVGSNGNPDRVGNPAYIEEDQGFLFASFLMAVAPRDQSALNPKYLYHYLNSPAIQQAITESVQGTTGLKNLSQRTIFNLPLPVYTEPEQRRIAEILDTVDAAIQATEALIAKLKQVKAGLLHDLLTRGIDEHGHLRDPYTHPEQFKDSPLGRIPLDWNIVPISMAAIQQAGSTTIGPFGSDLLADDYRSEGVPIVFVRDIHTDGFRWNSNVYVDSSKARALSAHQVVPGDLLATKMGEPPCVACVYPGWMPDGIVTADIIRLRPDLSIAGATWLSLYLNSEHVARQVRGITGGVTRAKVTLRDFRRLLVAVPPIDEQQHIESIAMSNDGRIVSEELHRDKLESTKHGLMDDLLTGRVRAGVVELDGVLR